MAVTVEDARRLTVEFCRIYPGARRLAFKFRRSTVELYGERAAAVPKGMQGGYLSRSREHAQAALVGRVDVPVDNMQDHLDFVLTLRHEVLGHYGANTFSPAEKRALLAGIIAARQEPTLLAIWQRVDALYASQSELVRAEEVFALVCESVTPPQISSNVVELGDAAFRETCLSGARPLRAADLAAICAMVAHGLRTNAREQKSFPPHGEVLERLEAGDPGDELGQTPPHVPSLLGPGVLGSLYAPRSVRGVAVAPHDDERRRTAGPR